MDHGRPDHFPADDPESARWIATLQWEAIHILANMILPTMARMETHARFGRAIGGPGPDEVEWLAGKARRLAQVQAYLSNI